MDMLNFLITADQELAGDDFRTHLHQIEMVLIHLEHEEKKEAWIERKLRNALEKVINQEPSETAATDMDKFNKLKREYKAMQQKHKSSFWRPAKLTAEERERAQDLKQRKDVAMAEIKEKAEAAQAKKQEEGAQVDEPVDAGFFEEAMDVLHSLNAVLDKDVKDVLDGKDPEKKKRHMFGLTKWTFASIYRCILQFNYKGRGDYQKNVEAGEVYKKAHGKKTGDAPLSTDDANTAGTKAAHDSAAVGGEPQQPATDEAAAKGSAHRAVDKVFSGIKQRATQWFEKRAESFAENRLQHYVNPNSELKKELIKIPCRWLFSGRKKFVTWILYFPLLKIAIGSLTTAATIDFFLTIFSACNRNAIFCIWTKGEDESDKKAEVKDTAYVAKGDSTQGANGGPPKDTPSG